MFHHCNHIRSFGLFEHLELPLSLYCDVHLLAANSKLVENFEPSTRCSGVIGIFAASMRVISVMTGNPPLCTTKVLLDLIESGATHQCVDGKVIQGNFVKKLHPI